MHATSRRKGGRATRLAVTGGLLAVGAALAAACTTSYLEPECPEQPCTLIAPQCGCEEDQACVFDGAARSCRVVGMLPQGAVCAVAEDCANGFACTQMAPALSSVCRRYCNHDAMCNGGGGRCVLPLHGYPDDSVRLCSDTCDPVADDCFEGATCRLTFTASVGYFTLCDAPGEAPEGSSCSDVAECAAGLGCVGTGGTPACRRWCASVADCSEGSECLSVVSESVDPANDDSAGAAPQLGGVTYGVCSI